MVVFLAAIRECAGEKERGVVRVNNLPKPPKNVTPVNSTYRLNLTTYPLSMDGGFMAPLPTAMHDKSNFSPNSEVIPASSGMSWSRIFRLPPPFRGLPPTSDDVSASDAAAASAAVEDECIGMINA